MSKGNIEQREEKEGQIAEYRLMIDQIKPAPDVFKNCLRAFLVGGSICLVGQLFLTLYAGAGLGEREAAAATAGTMVFLGALLTGLGVYDIIGKYGGAGSIIPITGFANSIVAPAMEFKREGFVFGVGARIFNIAGPVLVYGFIVSSLIGIITFLAG
ncbi:stage V sporulation protein AC [Thermacetogenium phaeum DSM 12270]|jgi:stage V sporulation protein AC|uniref:Stage V sporulation protein AC n=1 Tax=Thermacetogenium phaeum (strain ATCC BAA-254 / DSM 26808 / PB) TaxID=1089553 RepID=K4LIN8_THEPS|nr:stage V sporulation protein AC [Thermacetogenium phaeum]AFV11805.1 stage V sporulation protein AC [Thermacetogenium phaeum DSM 12270]